LVVIDRLRVRYSEVQRGKTVIVWDFAQRQVSSHVLISFLSSASQRNIMLSNAKTDNLSPGCGETGFFGLTDSV